MIQIVLFKELSVLIVCHFQTIKEIDNYDSSIANWIDESDSIHVYTDRDLLSFLIDDFGYDEEVYLSLKERLKDMKFTVEPRNKLLRLLLR